MVYDIIDLFSGCGGMTLGFLWDRLFHPSETNPVCRLLPGVGPSPFKAVWANDFDRDALGTYRANFDVTETHSVCGPIEDVLEDAVAEIPPADVVIGGPPCQGFSLLNKKRVGDERRELWWHFMEVAERAGAQIVVMENVPQLLRSAEFELMAARLDHLGFRYMMAHVLCAANYGVPQVRHRAIIMASKCGPITLPTPTHLSVAQRERLTKRGNTLGLEALPWVSTREVLGDLQRPKGAEIRDQENGTNRLHFGRKPTATSRARYRAVPEGGNRFDLFRNRPDLTPQCWIKKTSGGTDLFGRLWWDRPSVTIRTEFFKPEKGRYLHPDQHRPITHREAARLQAFPDRFHFIGSKIEIAKQIGNAVPPLLAYAIAREVQASLENRTTVEDMERTCAIFDSALGETIRHAWLGSPLFDTAGV